MALNRRTKQFVIEWGLGCIVGAASLPLALTALNTAAIKGRAVGTAFEQGELFLAAANCVVVGVLVLIAARGGMNESIGSLAALMCLAVPGYATWAFFAARALAGESYDTAFSTKVGAVWVVISAIFSSGLCAYAHPPDPAAEPNLEESRTT